MKRAVVVALALVAASGAVAAERVIVFRGATVLPIATPPIENGAVVVRGTTIEAVGASDELRVPRGAEIVELSGKVLMPGLVDDPLPSRTGLGAATDRGLCTPPCERWTESTFTTTACGGRAPAD